jgi:hypothetical protein
MAGQSLHCSPPAVVSPDKASFGWFHFVMISVWSGAGWVGNIKSKANKYA